MSDSKVNAWLEGDTIIVSISDYSYRLSMEDAGLLADMLAMLTGRSADETAFGVDPVKWDRFLRRGDAPFDPLADEVTYAEAWHWAESQEPGDASDAG